MDVTQIEFRQSDRARQLRLAVYRDGRVQVTIPRHGSRAAAEAFAASKQSWIDRAMARMQHRAARRLPVFSNAELPVRRREALELIRERLEYFANRYGVAYRRVTIKQLTMRWGSCSKQGNLNFNVKLLHLPERLVEYLLVHELCHLREMNHSPKFWALVEKAIPDYRACRRELRQNYALR